MSYAYALKTKIITFENLKLFTYIIASLCPVFTQRMTIFFFYKGEGVKFAEILHI